MGREMLWDGEWCGAGMGSGMVVMEWDASGMGRGMRLGWEAECQWDGEGDAAGMGRGMLLGWGGGCHWDGKGDAAGMGSGMLLGWGAGCGAPSWVGASGGGRWPVGGQVPWSLSSLIFLPSRQTCQPASRCPAQWGAGGVPSPRGCVGVQVASLLASTPQGRAAGCPPSCQTQLGSRVKEGGCRSWGLPGTPPCPAGVPARHPLTPR